MLPKCVCSVCWNQVRSFHTFYEFVRSSQNVFLTKLVKPEVSTELPLLLSRNNRENLAEDETVVVKAELEEPLIPKPKNAFAEIVDIRLEEGRETRVEKKVRRPRKKINYG